MSARYGGMDMVRFVGPKCKGDCKKDWEVRYRYSKGNNPGRGGKGWWSLYDNHDLHHHYTLEEAITAWRFEAAHELKYTKEAIPSYERHFQLLNIRTKEFIPCEVFG